MCDSQPQTGSDKDSEISKTDTTKTRKRDGDIQTKGEIDRHTDVRQTETGTDNQRVSEPGRESATDAG